MTDFAKLLTPPTNFAVVQLPERRYPGVVLQGDTLHGLVTQVTQMQKLLAERDLEELNDEIQSLLQNLSTIQKSYERVCSEQNTGLPYAR
jgi:hypothetical protein